MKNSGSKKVYVYCAISHESLILFPYFELIEIMKIRHKVVFLMEINIFGDK